MSLNDLRRIEILLCYVDLRTGVVFFRSRRDIIKDQININLFMLLRLKNTYCDENKQSQGEDSDRINCLDKQDEWK